MGGKWERKENGEGKGGKREHFPLLVRRENGRGKKMGKENSVGPCPIFPPTFSSQNGGILGQIFSPILALIILASLTKHFSHAFTPYTARASLFSIINIFLASILSLFSIILLVHGCGLIVEQWRTLDVCLFYILCLFSICVCVFARSVM